MSKFKNAKVLRVHERDHHLRLDTIEWPQTAPDGWRMDRDSTLLARTIAKADGKLDHDLWEAILRFPSAPIQGLHRVRGDHGQSPLSKAFHTVRLLAHEPPSRPPDTIYLLLNGLNESHSFELYYRLAGYLIQEDRLSGRQSVCLLRPFPGHMGRSRHERYAEQPLDKYLRDGSHLFQQFMRFMIETQWLLSVLATRSQYWCPAGAALLAGDVRGKPSRLSSPVLAKAIGTEWLAQMGASLRHVPEAAAGESGGEAADQRTLAELETVVRPAIERCVTTLRQTLCWDSYDHFHEDEPSGGITRPSVHVFGYSLGGFSAQSILMAWPFAVSSCSTLLAGGALRELAPTSFSHPEEWQTVLHSLRYELDDLMAAGHFKEHPDPSEVGLKRIAGIRSELFRSLHRVFYEVFEQEYRGSYQTRMSEYGRRMLFIVGGNDPIVRPQSVLDSAPPEGVNLVEIGGLGHFLREDESDSPQSRFWIPEAARLVSRFAESVVAEHARELKTSWLPQAEWRRLTETTPVKRPRRLTEDERLAIGPDGSMASPLCERSLDDLLARLPKGPAPGRGQEDDEEAVPVDPDTGYLFILRSEIPTALLPGELVLRRALNIHHDNGRVVDYAKGAISRGLAMKELFRLNNLTIVLSSQAGANLMAMDPPHGLPSQAETPVGYLPWTLDMRAAFTEIKESVDRLNSALPNHHPVRSFSADVAIADDRDFGDTLKRVLAQARSRMGLDDEAQVPVTAVPDCWIWVAASVLSHAPSTPLSPDVIDDFCRWAARQWKTLKTDKRYLRTEIAEERVRIIRLSGARFNPRYRGHVVADPRKAADLLLHAALCVSASEKADHMASP